jgi:hypothetical protein
MGIKRDEQQPTEQPDYRNPVQEEPERKGTELEDEKTERRSNSEEVPLRRDEKQSEELQRE